MPRLIILVCAAVAVSLVGLLLLFSLFAYCDYQDRAKWGTKAFSAPEWQAASRDTVHLYANDLLGQPDVEQPDYFSYRMKAQECCVDY